MKNSTNISSLPIYLISAIYFGCITAVLIYHRSWLALDQFIFFAFIISIFIGKTKTFLKDWIPFAILFFSYEYLRGLAGIFSNKVNITPMIILDKIMFGFLPTIKLQELYYNPNKLQLYDYISVFLYFSHFVFPPLIAFLFWLKNRVLFKQFIYCLLILSYLAFFTYLIYPAMPPWLAAKNNYIPYVHKIIHDVFNTLGSSWNINNMYTYMNPNKVAAMPSLHAAYPFLIFLFFIRLRHLIFQVLSFIYCFFIWLTLVYLGEHYVIDIIAGIIYATCTYYLFFLVSSIKNNKNKVK